jgi:hypothetical protein
LASKGRPIFRPFGIATDDDFLYIASHKKLGKYDKTTFEFIGLVNIPMYINTHQVLKSDDTFYVTHTATNSIGIHGKTDLYFDVETLKCVDKPMDPSNADTHDSYHVNSICEYGDKIYFCLHNLNKIPSQFGYFDKNTHESKIIASGGYCSHDVQILNDMLYSLSSGTGEIVEVDLITGHVSLYKVADSNKTFLRGMDLLNGKLIFSGSNLYSSGTMYMNNCYVSSFDPLTKEVDRQFSIMDSDIVTCMKII